MSKKDKYKIGISDIKTISAKCMKCGYVLEMNIEEFDVSLYANVTYNGCPKCKEEKENKRLINQLKRFLSVRGGFGFDKMDKQ
jgi:predicted Zn-ribbon and HTH transcriptional regulator